MIKVLNLWRLIASRTEAKAKENTSPRTKARTGGTMAVLATVLLAEDVVEEKVVETKEKAVERRKENQRTKAKTLAKRGRTRARWTPSSANFAWSMDIGRENVPVAWFNKLFKEIMDNNHMPQFNKLLDKEFSNDDNQYDNPLKRAILLLLQVPQILQ